MSKKAVFAGVLLLEIFVVSLLIWPDFRYEVDCGAAGADHGCAPVSTYRYDDFKLGGGWRWAKEHFCVADGKLFVMSDECSLATQNAEEQRSPQHAFIGSGLVTLIAALILFRLPRKSAIKP